MAIDIEELKEIISILLKQFIKSGIKEVELNSDYYWMISPNERENFTGENPPEPSVGSIIDDIEHLKKLIAGNSLPTLVDIDRFANVLIAISESISKSDIRFINQ